VDEKDKQAWENRLLSKYGIAQPVDPNEEVEEDMTCRIAYLWDACGMPGEYPG
jgi:hypothetical protein